ncbi:MAG: VOC family protein [Pseudomonadota bacterium]
MTAGAKGVPPEGAGVTGFGGFFFRAADPQGLATWYTETLGVGGVPKSLGDRPWKQQAGITIFAPFPADTDYFGDPEKVFMLNFRTDDLDALIAHIRSTGTDVTIDPAVHPQGRFARLVDPEGNPIELWEPAEAPK